MLNVTSAKDVFGWGVHVIEGPNKPLLAWSAAAILVIGFVVALAYDIALHNADSGFAIGQWMVAVLSTALFPCGGSCLAGQNGRGARKEESKSIFQAGFPDGHLF